MPSKGYRKGLSDRKTPLPKIVLTRLTNSEHAVLKAMARAHVVTTSKYVREVLRAKLTGEPPALPRKAAAAQETLRNLTRIGNNLNQLTKLAHQGILPIHAAELRGCLDHLTDCIRRL